MSVWIKIAIGIGAFFTISKFIGIEFGGILPYLVMGLPLYFLPAIIASQRDHKNSAPIFILNMFFGWTLIGWVGCLAWGLAHQERAAS